MASNDGWEDVPLSNEGWEDVPLKQSYKGKFSTNKMGMPIGTADEKPLSEAILGPLGRVADYAGGLGRTAVSGLINAAQYPFTGNSINKPDDVLNALGGNAPTSSEYMERAGVPSGPSANLFPEVKIPGTDIVLGKGETSARDAAGFLADIATDPMTIAAKAAKPFGEVMASGGKKFYKSGLTSLDNEAIKYGKEPVSEVLFKHGVTGNAKSLPGKMDALSDRLLNQRNDILKRASGGEVSMAQAVAPLQAKIQEIRVSKDPALQGVADALEGEVNKYLALDSKPATPVLRELPVSAKQIGPRTEIEGFKPKSVSYQELPKTKLSGERQMVDFSPGKEELINLPVSSSYQGPYQEMAGLGPLQPGKYTQKPGVTGLIQESPSVEKGLLKGAEYSSDVPDLVSIVEEGRALPGKTLPLEYVPQKPAIAYDEIPGVMGPAPLTASGYKSSIGAQIPDSAWRSQGVADAARSADKAFYGGMKTAVEDAVARELGQGDADLVKSLNSDLSGLLTTQDKAAIEAAKEANKPLISQTKAAVGFANLPAAIGMKAAEVMNMPGFRTRTGMGAYKAGKSGLIDPVLYRGLINGTSLDEQ